MVENAIGNQDCAKKQNLEHILEERKQKALELNIGQKIEVVTYALGWYSEINSHYKEIEGTWDEIRELKRFGIYGRGKKLVSGDFTFMSYSTDKARGLNSDYPDMRKITIKTEIKRPFLGIFRITDVYDEEVYRDSKHFNVEKGKREIKIETFKYEDQWIHVLNSLYDKTTEKQRLGAGFINGREMSEQERKEFREKETKKVEKEIELANFGLFQ